MTELSPNELTFFSGHEDALPLYERLREAILREIEGVSIEVRRTQISFRTRYLFAAVSFLPVRRKAQRPPVWLTVTFGLPHRLDDPRIDACSEPYPNRRTHHVLLGAVGEIDGQLLAWLREAAAFADARR